MTIRAPLVLVDGLVKQLQAGDTISTGAGAKNAIINGGMMVAQSSDLTLSLQTDPTAGTCYGAVDMWQAYAYGSGISAGTATQITNANCGRTGYALKLSGVSTSGTTYLALRHRIESRNAVRFKNQAASFSIRVYHDRGVSTNYALVINKCNSADNFSATTIITGTSSVAVASATETLVKFENISMGDCSNGFELVLKTVTDSTTTKNFEFAEAQLEEGTTATAFEYVDFGTELLRCQRYLEKNTNQYVVTSVYATNRTEGMVPFKVEKRASPTVTSGVTNWSYWYQCCGKWD